MNKTKDVNAFSAYLAELRDPRFDLLEPEDEALLARRWHEQRDEGAKRRLVESHLRLVIRLAKHHHHRSGCGVPELVSAGNEGLTRALEGFDPGKGRFTTYARSWIDKELTKYVEHSMRSMSVVKRSQDDVEENGLPPRDASLNAPIHDDDQEEDGQEQDLLLDQRPDPEAQLVKAKEFSVRREALRCAALAVLDKRARRIFEGRQLADDPLTLKELGTELGISQTRVRQIEVCAVEKVRASEKVQQVREDRTPKTVQSAAKNYTAARVHATCYFRGPPDWQDRPPPTAGKLVDGVMRKWYVLLIYYGHSPRWSPRWRKIVREISRKRRRAIEYPSTIPVRRWLSLFSLGEGIGRDVDLLEGKRRNAESLILPPPDVRLRDQLEAEHKAEAGAEDAAAEDAAAAALEAEKSEEDERADCVDCNVRMYRIGEWFVVRNEPWRRAWPRRKSWRPFGTRPRETICTGCLEKRIGGELALADFTCSPSVHAGDLSASEQHLIFGHFAIGSKSKRWPVGVAVNEKYEPALWRPALGISSGAWRDKQRRWTKGKRPKTEWPEIQGKPFVVRRQARDDLRTLGAAALEAFLARAERSRRPLRAMKFTWFPDGRAYEAMWENGQLAQYERDKWLASRAETDGAPRKLEPQPLLGPRYPSAKSTQAYAGYSSLPVELRMLALGLPLPDRPDGFALAAE